MIKLVLFLSFLHLIHNKPQLVLEIISPDLTYPQNYFSSYQNVIANNGSLTKNAMLSQKIMGQKIRQQYIETDSLLSNQFESWEIYVRSVDSDNLIQSLYAHLYGIYPNDQDLNTFPQPVFNEILLGKLVHFNDNLNFQAIPVHIQSHNKDYLLSNWWMDQSNCPGYNFETNFKNQINEAMDYLQDLSKLFKIVQNNMQEQQSKPYSNYDALIQYHYFAKDVVRMCELGYEINDITMEDLITVKKQLDFAINYIPLLFNFEKNKLSTTFIFNSILQQLSLKTENQTQLKLILLGATDELFQQIIAVLNPNYKSCLHSYYFDEQIDEPNCPFYEFGKAQSIIFELEEQEQYVTVYQNGQQLNFCDNTEQVCELEAFKEKLSDLTMSKMELKEFCLEKQETHSIHNKMYFLILLAIFIFGFVLIFSKVYGKGKDKQIKYYPENNDDDIELPEF